MVVLSHYFEAGFVPCGNEKLAHFMTSLGDPGCGIFFFLSGYALYLGYKDKQTDSRFLLNRLKNTYIPYIVIALFIAVYAKSLNSPRDVLRLLTGADYWFMITIFILYAVFFLVGKLPNYRVLIMNVFIFVMSMWLHLNGYAEFWYTATWCFGVGMIVAHFDGKNTEFLIDIKEPILAPLGKLSLYIYMLHMFIYYRVVNFPLLMGLNWYIQVLISFCITVVVAALLNVILQSIFKISIHKKITINERKN